MDHSQLSTKIDAACDTISALKSQLESISCICGVVVNALQEGHKLMSAGNGGSAAEAMHMSEELIGRFRNDRPSLPAIALTADSTALTCIGNDYGYAQIFGRQIEGLGQAGDVLVLFSTSGNGDSLMNAARAARQKQVICVGFLGRDGGALAPECDYSIVVPGNATERIQEAHQVLLHLVLDAVEDAFYTGSESE
ncbi:MAG: D-sedoheptulose 7-phosphate isomerase [Candidatus Promineifilaceae bacterium]|jgi:D-sedoheptulose 7-phosphate isomerase